MLKSKIASEVVAIIRLQLKRNEAPTIEPMPSLLLLLGKLDPLLALKEFPEMYEQRSGEDRRKE